MSQADLHGSTAFRYPTADELETELLAAVRRLAADAQRLGRTPRAHPQYAERRARVDDGWHTVLSEVALLRAEQRRETQRAARDHLYARLTAFLTDAEAADRASQPISPLTWRRALTDAAAWLHRWGGGSG